MGHIFPQNPLLFYDCQEVLHFVQLFLGLYNNSKFVRTVSMILSICSKSRLFLALNAKSRLFLTNKLSDTRIKVLVTYELLVCHNYKKK